jgi:hypothetical protein
MSAYLVCKIDDTLKSDQLINRMGGEGKNSLFNSLMLDIFSILHFYKPNLYEFFDIKQITMVY